MRLIDANYLKTWFGEKDLYTYDYIIGTIDDAPTVKPEQNIIRCKDCKYFYYDKPYLIAGIPVLGHEVCDKWGDGCKTDVNGYCFLAKARG